MSPVKGSPEERPSNGATGATARRPHRPVPFRLPVSGSPGSNAGGKNGAKASPPVPSPEEAFSAPGEAADGAGSKLGLRLDAGGGGPGGHLGPATPATGPGRGARRYREGSDFPALSPGGVCPSPDGQPEAWTGHPRVPAATGEAGEAGEAGETCGERKVERVSNLEQALGGGDVVLFRCQGVLSQLQRWISRSEWDHVGMVGLCACAYRRLSWVWGRSLELVSTARRIVFRGRVVECLCVEAGHVVVMTRYSEHSSKRLGDVSGKA